MKSENDAYIIKYILQLVVNFKLQSDTYKIL